PCGPRFIRRPRSRPRGAFRRLRPLLPSVRNAQGPAVRHRGGNARARGEMRAATPGQPKNRERSGLPHGGGGEPPALPGRQCRTFVRSSSHRSFLCVVADAVRKRPPGHPSRQTVPYKHSLPTGIRHRRPGGRKTVRGAGRRKRRETRSLILGKTVSVYDRCSTARTVKAIIKKPRIRKSETPRASRKTPADNSSPDIRYGGTFPLRNARPAPIIAPPRCAEPPPTKHIRRSASGKVHPATVIRRPDGPCDPGRT